jgi:hypothetical protein
MVSASSASVCRPSSIWELGALLIDILSGGPATYSQLLILKECMGRLVIDLDISEDDVYRMS